ncbi:MAG: arginine--tRNA ligase [Candidatus Sericytochromatia bacterium]
MNVLAEISHVVREALAADHPGAEPNVARTQDPQFGDYQSNAAMPLAKALKKNPREVAEALIARLDFKGMAEPATIAGPGFINIRLSNEFLGQFVAQAANDPRGGVSVVARPETVVVEFSSPNVAKRLHVGHLRSTIIGDAMNRIFRFLGHHAISDNHVGDWGTQFGLLIVGWRRWADQDALDADPIGHLEDLYRRASEAAKADSAFADEARAELAKLQAGDPDNLALWKRFVEISRRDVEGIYDMLDVRFDHWLGESFYDPYLEELAKRLLTMGVAREDQGASVIFFEGDAALEDKPFIIRKKDGAYLYSTTDLATIEYRMREWRPDRVLYFVDARQALHFKQLFAAARKMGLSTDGLEHVPFGTILNAEGKPLKTRDGNTPSLRALLQEGVDAAHALVRTKQPDMAPDQMRSVARAVGIAAIKYADLSQNRLTDYKFDLAKMVSFEGDTGPYLQYTHARISSIFRKLDAEWQAPATVSLSHPDEIALARHMVKFQETLEKVAEANLPNFLCDYLFGLAKAFSAFYTTCPVLKAEGQTRESRLALARATQHQLAVGLRCLGIEPLETM